MSLQLFQTRQKIRKTHTCQNYHERNFKDSLTIMISSLVSGFVTCPSGYELVNSGIRELGLLICSFMNGGRNHKNLR